MAKQTFPGINTGGGVLKKVLAAAVVFALLGLILNDPAGAATLIKGLFDLFGELVNALSVLFKGLLG
ncbi:hypothetical protein [Saccharopolyspora hattusasensis]|uniref:hypothetical protein n=1 Tax=Saccharopolyspora hattusasensis TaxID=1128679 RepID=UPI003D999112